MSVIRHRRQFTKEFKYQVVREVEAGKPLAQVARENEIRPNLVAKWRTQLSINGAEALQGNGNAYTHEAKLAELERITGQQAVAISLLKKVLRLHDDEQAPSPQRGMNGTVLMNWFSVRKLIGL
jgi:transposase